MMQATMCSLSDEPRLESSGSSDSSLDSSTRRPSLLARLRSCCTCGCIPLFASVTPVDVEESTL